jgi:predicted dinucleotide-binding enzyme
VQLGVLGTGVVGTTLGGGWVAAGHEVRLGSRSADNAAAVSWAAEHGAAASHGTFADAASFGEVVVNATSGAATLAALSAAGADQLAGKVLIDVSNPLDFSGGFPPTLLVKDTDSLAEQVQRAFPLTRVVKTLNTMGASVMVAPGSLSEPSDAFVAGDDAAAKDTVRGLLAGLGWSADHVIDLGTVDAARGMEMYLPLWLRIMQASGTADFNLRVVR